MITSKMLALEKVKEILNAPKNGFKRARIRTTKHCDTPFVRPTKGVVHDIINLTQFVGSVERKPVAQHRCEDYVNLLQKNYEKCGVPFRRPNVYEKVTTHHVPSVPEKHIEHLDQVLVRLTVLKNGRVRLNCNTQAAELYDKYYSNGKPPPFKVLTAVYKKLGYSDAFLNKLNESYKKKRAFADKLGKVLELIFEKTTVKSKKKKPPPPPPTRREESDDEEDEEENDGPEEDEALVGDDEEEDVEEDVEEDLDLED